MFSLLVSALFSLLCFCFSLSLSGSFFILSFIFSSKLIMFSHSMIAPAHKHDIPPKKKWNWIYETNGSLKSAWDICCTSHRMLTYAKERAHTAMVRYFVSGERTQIEKFRIEPLHLSRTHCTIIVLTVARSLHLQLRSSRSRTVIFRVTVWTVNIEHCSAAKRSFYLNFLFIFVFFSYSCATLFVPPTERDTRTWWRKCNRIDRGNV